MRFNDIRRSVVKKTGMDEGTLKLREPATVQRISPYRNGNPNSGLRNGIVAHDVFRETHNRESRRANGMVKPRKRLRGNYPPHPLAVIVKAHRIEREGERLRQKKIREVLGIGDARMITMDEFKERASR